jgi:general secretion pathway protein C
VPAAPRATSEESSSTPSLEDPSCTFGRVVLIADSDDPEWSFAAIEHQGSSKLRRMGDDVEGHKLEAMSWDRVWLKSATARCQMKMGDTSAAPAPKPAPRSPGTADPRRIRRRASDKLPDELASKIQKVSDTEFNVERAVVDAILEQQATLMRRTRVRPVKNGDKTTGISVSRIGAGSLFDSLGIKNGDEIRSINGFELTDPQKALEAYGRLRSANRLTVQVVRGGAPTTIEFNIK